MKKKLLLIILPMLVTTTLTIAQDRTWDIGTTSASWPIDLAEIPANDPDKTIDGLTIVAGSSTFGGMRAADYTFSDAFSAVQEWQSNGSSSGTAALPSRRYFSFPVSGPSTIKVWFRANGDGPRSAQIGDGTNVLGVLGSANSADVVILTATYNDAGAGTIYISSDASINYHKISVVDGVLGVDEKASTVSTNVKAVNNRVYISNVKSSTEVNIYSITGALIKSLKINEATNFSLKQGMYIATVKTLEGQKSVKLLLQ